MCLQGKVWISAVWRWRLVACWDSLTPVVMRGGASGSTTNVQARNQKKSTRLLITRVLWWSPALMRALSLSWCLCATSPPWVSRTACIRLSNSWDSGPGRRDAPTIIHCVALQTSSMIWEWWIWDWSFCSFQTQCLLLLQLKLLDAVNYMMTSLCAASSSLPVSCAPLMFSGLLRKLSAKSFLLHWPSENLV